MVFKFGKEEIWLKFKFVSFYWRIFIIMELGLEVCIGRKVSRNF